MIALFCGEEFYRARRAGDMKAKVIFLVVNCGRPFIKCNTKKLFNDFLIDTGGLIDYLK